MGGQMQSIIASELFAPIVGADFAVARMSALSSLAMIASALAFLYKPLCDKYGRRLFLVLNTLGMGVGSIFVSLATNIPVYLIGTAFTAFFTPHDMQAIYIQECAPAKYRASIYSTIKAIATLGMFMIPVLRSVFIPGTDLSGWRYVYLVPGVVTVVAAVAAFFLIKESDAFVDNRLRQLKMTDEEIAAAKEKKNDSQAQGGLIKSLKLAWRNKQIRWLIISYGFIMWGMLVNSYYESTMTYGYAQQFLDQGMDIEAAKAAATSFVTQALMLFSVGSALFQFFPGFLADKLGRKKTAVIMSASVVVTFLLFYIGANNNWNPYVVGFFCGACIGSYWYTGDLMGLMISESTPTNLRASMLAVQPMVSGTIFSVAMVAVMVLINILGDAAIGICTVVTIIPGMLVGLILMMLKVKETNGVDMGSVSAE
jgi:MFS family permease